MTKQIRKLGIVLTVCYLALFVQLNFITVFRAEELKDKPENHREAERDFDSERGSIITADNVVIAESVANEAYPDNDRFKQQRSYPTLDLFGQITGYYNPLSIGSTGLENQYNDALAGRDLNKNNIERIDDYFEDFFSEKENVGNLTLTMRNDVQETARNALGEQKGSVVALDPRTGGILSMWSWPSYDPNPLASHDFSAAAQASEQYNADPRNDPRLARSYRDDYAPGSTFKVVTATAGVETNRVTRDEPDYPVRSDYSAPNVGGSPIPNFGGASCGGTLFEILQRSCNTAFAEMGVEQVGPADMVTRAEAFGFNKDVPIDLPQSVKSSFPTDVGKDQFLAQDSIGQKDVRATPLQMAMIAAAVANGGEIKTPHVLKEIRDQDQEVVRGEQDEVWTTAMSQSTAEVIREAMISVVTEGTAENLANDLEGFEVGGKTGTAQLGDTGTSHAWIIGFAGPPGETPQVAVAVIVEAQPGNSEQTGGQVAAPIASQVMAAALAGG